MPHLLLLGMAALSCQHQPPAGPAEAPVEVPVEAPAEMPGETPPLPILAATAPLPGCSVPPGQRLPRPAVVGSLPELAVQEAMFQQLGRVAECLERGIGYELLQQGQLVVRLSVAPSGRVTATDIAADSTGADPEVRDCLLARFDELVFPRASSVSWICYPINIDYE